MLHSTLPSAFQWPSGWAVQLTASIRQKINPGTAESWVPSSTFGGKQAQIGKEQHSPVSD